MTYLRHAKIWDGLAEDFRARADYAALRGELSEADRWVLMSRFATGVADAYVRAAVRENVAAPRLPDRPGSEASPQPQATTDRRAASEGENFDVVTGPLPRYPQHDE